MRQIRRILVASAVVSVAAGIVLLRRFPPTAYSFNPRCPIKEYLHLECPGCGATRAISALLQGHLIEALHFNALFVTLLPFLTGYALLSGYRAWKQEIFRWPSLPRQITYAALALALLFTIARNFAG